MDTVKLNRIIVAEDDDDDFDLFHSAMLSINSTADVIRTSDGFALSSLLEAATKPDVIFLDLNMPYKGGLECLQKIRSKHEFDGLKVVVYTTSSNPREIEKCYAGGADFYVVKPSNYELMISQLEELFHSEYFIMNVKPPRKDFVIN